MPAFSGNDQINAAVVSGEIDWGGLVADPDKTFVAKDPEHNHYWWPTTTNVCLFMNTTKPPFDDVKFRKAVGASLNREQMISTALWGKSTPANATGLADSAYKDWIDQAAVDAGKDWVTYNVDTANKMFDDAGYPKGDGDTRTTADGNELKFSVIVPGGWTDWVAVLQVVVNNLKDVGIDVELKTISADAWTTSVYTGDFDMSLGTGSRGATPFEFYRGTMSSSTYKPVGEQAPENYHRYQNADADALLSQFAESGDPAQQKDLVNQLEALFVQEAPIVPLYGAPDWGLFTTKRITGFPDESNPYAPLTNLGNWPTTLLVFPHLKPAQ
jgi:peptide/nickel transport system substrate-binding protein